MHIDNHLKRCSRCVLPETYPYIRFDDQGVCNFCRDQAPTDQRDLKGEVELRRTIDKLRNHSGRYDSIVALSGGRDSAYMAWYAVRKLGLKPLAFTVNNGFMPE